VFGVLSYIPENLRTLTDIFYKKIFFKKPVSDFLKKIFGSCSLDNSDMFPPRAVSWCAPAATYRYAWGCTQFLTPAVGGQLPINQRFARSAFRLVPLYSFTTKKRRLIPYSGEQDKRGS
jgi:hypothetical protein